MTTRHKLLLLIFSFLSFAINEMTLAQIGDLSVYGQVVDKETSKPMSLANISVKGKSIGTTTRESGYFDLQVPSNKDTLIVSYVGYKKNELAISDIKDLQNFTIYLEQSSEQLENVIVYGEKEKIIRVAPDKISSVSISPTLISHLPNFGEVDIMRAFQLLPGVSGSNETSAGLYVRGGTPDQNLILFDGMSIYHVDHFYGFFSAFNANSVDDVELYKGGFPAEYGGRVSSVLDIKGKPADFKEVKGGGGISALSANGYLEVPLIRNKMSLQLSARRSYTDLIKTGLYDKIFNLYNDESEIGPGPGGGFGRFGQQQTEPAFHFFDMNAKLTYKITEKDKLSYNFYGGNDLLDNSREMNFPFNEESTGEITDIINWGNIGSSLQWERNWTKDHYSEAYLSYSNYFSYRDRMNEAQAGTTDRPNMDTHEDNNVRDLSLRLNGDWNINKDNVFSYGGQITYNDISYKLSFSDTTTLLNQQNYGTQYALYLQDKHTFFDKLTLNGGIRGTYFDKTDQFYLQPRINATLNIFDDISLKGAWGIYNQFITRTVREDVTGGSKDFWLLSNDNTIPVSEAEHYILGLSYEPDGYLFQAEGFYKNLSGLSEFSMRYNTGRFRPRDGDEEQDREGPERYFFEGDGITKGIELLAQKKLGNSTGWIAYTLSSVKHTFPEMNNGEPFYALHDQTHELKAVFTQKLNNWIFSAAWIYATGTPYTAPIAEYHLTMLDGTENSYIHVSEKNALRLPDYHRLDVSATYEWKWRGNKASVSLSIFNLYDHQNVWYKEYSTDSETGSLLETNVSKLGIAPNISFNIDL